MKQFFLIATLCLSVACQPAKDHAYNYINPESISPTLIAPPPADGSDAKRQEIEQIILRQKYHTPAQLNAAMKTHHPVTPELMTYVIGKDFNRERLPFTFDFLEDVVSDCFDTVEVAKIHFNNKRPYLADKRVKALVPNPNTTGAYPSGHTACSRVWAEVMGQLAPTKQAALRARADEMGEHRILLGVHYPHDVASGKNMALLIVGALQQSEKYQADLARAKAEIAK